MTRWQAAGAAALSGVLVALSFPKLGSGAVAWVALVPLLSAIGARGGGGAGRLAYLAGVLAAFGTLYWTALVVVQYGGLPRGVAAVLMALLCLVFASFNAVFGWLLGIAVRAWGTWALLLAPVAWVGTEALRSHVLFRFPWCLLGYSQHDRLPILQVASLGGVLAVSFLIVLVASALAILIAQRGRGARVWVMAVGIGLLWLVTFAWGAARLAEAPVAARTLRVGLVQAAIPQDEKWDPARAWANIDAHVQLSRQAARAGARLVVWPESAVPFYFDGAPYVAAELRELTREENVPLLFGNDDREGEGAAGRVFVGAKLLDPQGRVAFRYHKMRLVPFGEYVPMESLLGALGVEKLVQEVGSFTPGRAVALAEVDGVRFGVSICYEAIFSDLARAFVVAGADVLVNVTNDAWYGRTSAPYQHFAMARVRAVETGRSYVRVANTGISAVVDPRGRLLGRTALFEPAMMVKDVPVATATTPYVRYGDVVGRSCLAGCGAWVAWALATVWRRRQRAGRDPVQ